MLQFVALNPPEELELDEEELDELELLDELMHMNPHPPVGSQPPEQLPELHEHGQFCGWEMVQQLWELQPPEELELEEVLLLDDELDDEELELEELLLVVPGHGPTPGPVQPQPAPVVQPVMLMTVLMLFTFGPPSGDTEIRFNCPV